MFYTYYQVTTDNESKAVIRQDPKLRIDQIKLPYTMLVKTLQQRIINILMRSYNYNPSQAYDIWSKALVQYDDSIGQILNNIIRESGEGIPCIINRNPTMVTLWFMSLCFNLLKKKHMHKLKGARGIYSASTAKVAIY